MSRDWPYKSILFLSLLSFLLASCAHQPGRSRDFSVGQRVQVIEVTANAAVYAQDDVMLEDDSLRKGLSDANPKWREELARAKTRRTLGVVSLVTQILTLGVCAGGLGLGWCAGSIGIGWGITRPLMRAAEKKQLNVVREYNDSLGEVQK